MCMLLLHFILVLNFMFQSHYHTLSYPKIRWNQVIVSEKHKNSTRKWDSWCYYKCMLHLNRPLRRSCSMLLILMLACYQALWFESNYLKINWARRQAVAIGPSLYEYEIHLNGGTCRDARYT